MWSIFKRQQQSTTAMSGGERKSVSMFMPQIAAKFFANTSASYETLAGEGYAVNWAANACINKISSSLASVEWKLYKRTRDKVEEVDDHELLRLINRPNLAQSRVEFLTTLYTTFLIGGNAYIYGNGLENNPNRQPTELQLLNPGKMKIEPSRTSYLPAYYEYKLGNDSRTFKVDQVSGKSAIMHLKTVNPLSPLYGLSPLVASAFSIDTINSGKKWNKKLLDNDARPSGALVVKDAEGKPGNLGEEQYARITQMIDQIFTGANNAGRPLLLEGGLEWQEMSMTPKDLDFVKGAYSCASDVAIALGVPPQLLGIPGANTYANMEQAKIAFWTDTIIPWLCWMLEGFNRWLTPLFGDDLYLWYDDEMIPALELLRKEKYERLNNCSFMTINEKRQAAGLDTIPEGMGGDSILVDGNKVPLDLAGDPSLSEPGSQASGTGDDGGDD